MSLEVTLVIVLAAVLLLLIAAQFLRVPYPILLVLGGLGLGVTPGIPHVELHPDLVLLIMLPPLLYAAAFFTPLRELRRNVRPISVLAIGLVLATMATVAIVAHEAIGFDWPTSFVLGAIVSPTDPVAATAIAKRLGVPGRIVTILEGESLINDATALVAYKFAVAAVVTGSFSLGEAVGDFFVNVAGGVAIGVAVVATIRRRLDNPPVEVTIALFTAYFAYLPAEELGVSGVVAAVTVGIYMGRLTSALTSPTTRIQGTAVWEIVVFVLNSALFVLIGLQLPNVLDGIDGQDTWELIGYGALLTATVMLTRIVWTFVVSKLIRMLIRELRGRPGNWKQTAIGAWTGMRGAVSLAAALALPFETDAGAPFPHRELIVFLTFSLILGTLVIQGLSLPALIHALGVDDHDEALEREESKARLRAAESALARIDELADEDWVRDDTADRLRRVYDYRLRRFRSRFADEDGESRGFEERASDYQRLLREVLNAQRTQLLEMRDAGTINDEVMQRIERELDLEDTRLEI
jgi:monovalent cation/hydrogen antiporter